MSGKTFYANNLTKQTGTLALSGNAGAGDVLSGKTFYANNLTKQTGTLALSGNASAADVLSGKTFYSNNAKSKLTGTMGTMAGGTYDPSTSQRTISCSGKKMTSNIIINAMPSNYKKIEFLNTIVSDKSYNTSDGLNSGKINESTFMNIDTNVCPMLSNVIYIFQEYFSSGGYGSSGHVYYSNSPIEVLTSYHGDSGDDRDIVRVRLIKSETKYMFEFTPVSKLPPMSIATGGKSLRIKVICKIWT